jgi:hypothetical protein
MRALKLGPGVRQTCQIAAGSIGANPLSRKQNRCNRPPVAASVNGSGALPAKRVRPRAGRAQPSSRQAAHTRSGVAGMASRSAPPPGTASAMAFITAAMAAVVPASPVPLTPSGLVVAGTI